MSLYSYERLRLYRKNSSIRKMMQDVMIDPAHLILPLFISDKEKKEDIMQMPYVSRLGGRYLEDHIQKCIEVGIVGFALFPVIEEHLKSEQCEEAWNDNSLMARSLRILKNRFPQALFIADIALDPFHIQGHDGLLTADGCIDNDKTVQALVQQALCYTAAGADIIAPSDMMDGRIRAISKALEESAGSQRPLILSYCTKFASCLYGPFRHAVDSARFLKGANKKTYQMDYASSFQIPREYQSDIDEGADILMVKPATLYLDVIQQLSAKKTHPIWAYHVSGECSLIWNGAQNGILNFEDALIESLFAMKRAGSQCIITYFATQAAERLKKG